MAKIADLRRRLDAIRRATAGTFSARFRELTDGEKATHYEWRAANVRWRSRHNRQPGDAYQALLNGTNPPALPQTIREKLFGPVPALPLNATIADARDAYARMLHGD